VISRKAGILGKDEKSLETNALQFQLDSIRQQIDGVYATLQAAPQRMQDMFNQTIQASADLQNVIDNADSQIKVINEQFNLAQSAQSITAATTELNQGAKEIGETVGQFQAIGPVQEQAKSEILKAVEDGKITAQEQVLIGQNLAILMSTLKTGQSSQLKGIQDLINMNNTLQTQMSAMQRQIDQLNQRRKSPTGVN
jgi:uncharacterized coiled-coil DUF342 family protein